METIEGCKRGSQCDYLHATRVEKGVEDYQTYACISCKDTWENRSCVIEYGIQGIKTYFCLNCDEWVKNKAQVFEDGWTLLDGEGYLRINL